MTTSAQVEQLIHAYYDEDRQITLGEAKTKVNTTITAVSLDVSVTVLFPVAENNTSLVDALAALLQQETGLATTVSLDWNVVAHKVQQGVPAIANVKNIIAIASGKGGVGKSTTSVNLALALAAEGARVGILDADIYGPSQPRMLGKVERPESKDGKSMEPVISHGIQSMSMGFLIDEEEPMIWRGPMVTQALEQLLRDTNWDNLDYLVIDLPPGTGDIQLTLSQKVPVSGAVIVTTPQDISLLDARKALKMFQKVKVPVFGVIENMSTHICSQCGHEEPIFGQGGGDKMAAQYDVDLLGQIPLDIQIREDVDNGEPTVARDPVGAVSQAYRSIARRVVGHLVKQGKNYGTAFPNIVVENN